MGELVNTLNCAIFHTAKEFRSSVLSWSPDFGQFSPEDDKKGGMRVRRFDYRYESVERIRRLPSRDTVRPAVSA